MGRDRGLAVKVDDGSYRGFHALLVELCARFGISRKTGYKIVARYREEGLEGLKALEGLEGLHGLKVLGELEDLEDILADLDQALDAAR